MQQCLWKIFCERPMTDRTVLKICTFVDLGQLLTWGNCWHGAIVDMGQLFLFFAGIFFLLFKQPMPWCFLPVTSFWGVSKQKGRSLMWNSFETICMLLLLSHPTCSITEANSQSSAWHQRFHLSLLFLTKQHMRPFVTNLHLIVCYFK